MTDEQQEKTDIKPNILKITKWAFKIFDIFRGPYIFEFFWHIFTKVTPLKEDEIKAVSKVFGTSPSRFNTVRVAEGTLFKLTPWLHKNRPFVTFHTINLVKPRDKLQNRLKTIVHELTHVYQFELAGSIYLWQALRVQWKEHDNAYNYGKGYHVGERWKGLKDKRVKGWHFRDYCREQQAKIAEDYYWYIIENKLLKPEDKAEASKAYTFYIDELKNGKL